MKDELGWKMMKEMMYSYLTDDGCVDRKAKGT